MEHSQAILADAGKAMDRAARAVTNDSAGRSQPEGAPEGAQENERRTKDDGRRKRKADFPSSRLQHGSRGGRNNGPRHQKSNMGRGEYFRDQPDKRQKTSDSRDKRQRDGNAATYGKEFSKDEIDAEERRPKRKVAVLIGYSGTGYKGMQITPSERTIEGDLFKAFIDAGAISKANADDPKKASLVRCARTDKGVHAAGNMISLKLIVEDEDIVERINSHLSPQIRVWGIERTIGSFSCYQACDSRWYEYLIPSHAFLPPHPSSWMAKKLEELADEAGDRSGYELRQVDVKGFWARVDDEDINPTLAEIDEDIRWDVVKALQGEEEASAKAVKSDADVETSSKPRPAAQTDADANNNEEKMKKPVKGHSGVMDESAGDDERVGDVTQPERHVDQPATTIPATSEEQVQDGRPPAHQLSPAEYERQQRLRSATKRLRDAYISAKRRYRIPESRIERIQAALTKFVGTANYHNYTVQKSFRDPSAKRHIKSFIVNPKTILIGDGPNAADKSEWLSLKVHGQSFMMHQIRKMIGMVALLVRCGSDLSTLDASFSDAKFSIPKVPGLGLLLERPVFDSYNTIQAVKHGREPLLFDKFEEEIVAFKEREIYQRIFREEEQKSEFVKFFNHVDNFKEAYFLYVSSMGLEATKMVGRKGGDVGLAAVEGSESEAEDVNGEEG